MAAGGLDRMHSAETRRIGRYWTAEGVDDDVVGGKLELSSLTRCRLAC